MTRHAWKWLLLAAVVIGLPIAAYANITSVGVTNGVPTSGTGTVSTIDALMADGGQATIGAKADAACATDTGNCTLVALQKRGNQNISSGTITTGTATNPSSQTITNVGPNKTVSRFKVAANDNHQTLQTGGAVITDLIVGANATLSGSFNYVRLYDSGAAFNGCNSATGVKFSMPFTSPGVALKDLNIAVSSGIAVCVTGADGDTDTTAATASATTVTVLNR